ncbi:MULTISPECIES: uracil permease [Caproicibacterium]|jgi:uracil permease|uniref:Uracil permease n=1 Tax=Caproicibacterium lactatifermentans TaxID=2666138 RepID=A0A859DQT6_9FIRM|nr:uracil permease [Caproicibacterium lactatifermentans]ARP50400.1 uracil permease [Ruminococcaceae bacterium CPB6]QKN23879.1 uracil permease [Caproicibacterium lactatifermentans]QKO31051.1 uracil permease [Caproicibacterium lactatifermentans]
MKKHIIQVEERPPIQQFIPLSLQHLFAMFSASVLVPTLLGINPAVVLFMNGVGTLIYILVTKGKAPAYLGSSFAYIAPATIIIGSTGLGYAYALGGFVVTGALFCVIALIIKFCGTKWIDAILPPAAMGAVVALIGLELSGTAAKMGGLVLHDNYKQIDPKQVIVFLITLCVAVFGSVLFKKFLAVIPILVAIVVGYVVSACLGMVQWGAVNAAPVFAIPHFQMAKFNWNAISIVLPATLVVVSEHIGHQIVTSKIVGRNIIKDPGLHRTLMGDGVSTMISGLVGSVPTTTYGENIGVMAMTGVYSVWVIGGAAVISIIISFFGKVSAVIQAIPSPVMGGVSFLLYGMIATSGIRLLVEQKVDYSRSRNLAMTSVILVTGLSGAFIQIGQIQLTGMSLGACVAMIMGFIFWIIDKFHAANDYDDAEEPSDAVKTEPAESSVTQ